MFSSMNILEFGILNSRDQIADELNELLVSQVRVAELL
jgi:hypothetical protein